MKVRHVQTHGRGISQNRQLVLCGALALVCAWGILTVNIPVAWGTPEYANILTSRSVTLAVIAVVVVAQACSTVLFHTITENRLLTPAILGFDAVFVLIRTILVVVWGGLPQNMMVSRCSLRSAR